jgi:hypothetical protein
MATTTKRTDLPETQTDWQRLRSMTDEDIARAVANDPDAAPLYTAEELKRFKPAPARNKR